MSLAPSSTLIFPQFSLLPPEIRDVIWRYVLYPSTKVHKVTVTRSRWDPLDHQAYAGAPTEGSIWYFALAPARRLPPHLFICRDAYEIGVKYYYRAMQTGYFLENKNHFLDLVEDYEPFRPKPHVESLLLFGSHQYVPRFTQGIPPTQHQFQPLSCSFNSLVFLTLPSYSFLSADISSYAPAHPLTPTTSIHAIHASNPLSFINIPFVAVDMNDFFGWIHAPTHATVLFGNIKVLFFVTNDNDALEGKGVFGSSLKEGLKESIMQTSWGVERFEFVRCLEDARRAVENMENITQILSERFV